MGNGIGKNARNVLIIEELKMASINPGYARFFLLYIYL
jgi:hypothetical protein